MSARYFIIGDPVSHSISPCIHNALFSHFHLDFLYEAVHVKRGDLAEFFLTLRDNYRGGNVTVPHKVGVLDYVTDLGDEVKYIGAVNTITILDDGRVRGNNTDSSGFIHSLKMELKGSIPEPVVVLGAGGAARGIMYGLLSMGIKKCILINRTLKKAEELSREISNLSSGVTILVSGLGGSEFERSLTEAGLIVNATTLGLDEDFTDFPFALLKKGTTLVDIVYRTGDTYLVKEGLRRGFTCIGALPMLAAQAAFAFQLWTKILPDYHMVKNIAARCLEDGKDLKSI